VTRRLDHLAHQDAPVIGLTTYVEPARWGAEEEAAALLPHSYVAAVTRVGAYPVLLPPAAAAADRVLSRLDGLVLTGGPDVAPARYAAVAHPQTGAPRTERDAWELDLCQGALSLSLPLLAICRGLQVLNVALGGTLHQHLPEVVGHDGHRPEPGRMGTTPVSLLPGTAICAVLGEEGTVLCHHHQAIDHLGAQLRATGYALDGTVEAVEVAGQPFAWGVQWHPEDDPEDDRLFAALAEAAQTHGRMPQDAISPGSSSPGSSPAGPEARR
jgi:gamma-glutamyl-gamma-aminobutyrate hydrolase PuuD